MTHTHYASSPKSIDTTGLRFSSAGLSPINTLPGFSYHCPHEQPRCPSRTTRSQIKDFPAPFSGTLRRPGTLSHWHINVNNSELLTPSWPKERSYPLTHWRKILCRGTDQLWLFPEILQRMSLTTVLKFLHFTWLSCFQVSLLTCCKEMLHFPIQTCWHPTVLPR